MALPVIFQLPTENTLQQGASHGFETSLRAVMGFAGYAVVALAVLIAVAAIGILPYLH